MKIYVVQNIKGQYFRNIGFGGNGKSWRDKLEDAKFYTKIGQAKSRVTFWFKQYPQYGCPRILAFNLGEDNQEVIEMEKETEKKILSAEKREAKYKLAGLKRQLQDKQANHDKLEQEISGLEKKIQSL